MSAIDPAVSQVLQARQQAQQQQINTQLLAKQLDVTKQTGDAMNEMLATVLKAQSQIAESRLDVRV